ncbi:hypothetical protein DFJ74DRAFT_163856 [Hyaloraphidium curvatum]|nr:hypothetical protein DFJ74DRAFT_163856 [Hyaloraphidium curvatum]
MVSGKVIAFWGSAIGMLLILSYLVGYSVEFQRSSEVEGLGIPDSCRECDKSSMPSVRRESGLTVVDFNCYGHPYPFAYFHLILDCLTRAVRLLPPLRSLSRQKSDVLAVVPLYLQRFFTAWLEPFLSPANVSLLFLDHRTPWQNQTAITASHVLSYDVSTPQCPNCLRELALLASNASANVRHSCRHVVLIVRKPNRGRHILDEDILQDQLKTSLKRYRTSFVVFRGNETLDETVQTFASACVVIGVHGAGLVHALFSWPWALIIEVVTFKESRLHAPNSTTLWRTNAGSIRGLPETILWQWYYVEHEHLEPYPTQAANSSQMTLNIRPAGVRLSREHIANIVSRTIVRLSSLGRQGLFQH